MNKFKVFVIGVDSATLDLIEPWVKTGKLPTFQKLMNHGAYGELTSVILSNSAPAWISAITGKNPGKHGIFYFTDLRPKSVGIHISSSYDVRSEMIWEILNKYGKKTIIVNVPITYPPKKVNGILIAGLPAPTTDASFVYPPKLRKKLLEMGYEIQAEGAHFFATGKDKYMCLKRLCEAEEKRAHAVLYLLENYDWDFAMVVFQSIDSIQHKFWRYTNPSDPLFDTKDAEKYGKFILKCYQHIDKIIEKLINKVDENTFIIAMSDHGAGPGGRYFFVNKWLMQRGLLVTKKIQRSGILSFLGSYVEEIVRRMPRKLAYIALRVGTKYLLPIYFTIAGVPPEVRFLMDPFSFADERTQFDIIDWSLTSAYCPTAYGVLNINVRGRDRYGIVESGRQYEDLRNSLIKTLSDLRDPESGKRAVGKVFKREEVYWGPYVSEAPDLLFEYEEYSPSAEFHSQSLFSPANLKTGEHRINGVLFVTGPHIKRGFKIEHSKILDISPTILHMMGIPIPSDMDGRVLKEIFEENSSLARKGIEYREDEDKGGHVTAEMEETREVFDEGEKKKVEDRLRGLGYI